MVTGFEYHIAERLFGDLNSKRDALPTGGHKLIFPNYLVTETADERDFFLCLCIQGDEGESYPAMTMGCSHGGV